MKKVISLLCLTTVLLASCFGFMACEHEHEFSRRDISDKYVKVKGNCEKPGEYYCSCSCGKKGEEVFYFGSAPGHKYENDVCIVCGEKRVSIGLQYTLINKETEYEVSGIGVCTDKEIIIPDEYKGKKVSRVGDEAFKGCDTITKVTIPEGVTNIGVATFKYCTYLSQVLIPNSIIEVGINAFADCSNLMYETQEGLKYLGNKDNTFVYLAGAFVKTGETYNINAKCRVVGSYVFENCTNLTNINIPLSIKSIGAAAFENCSKLEKVEIPAGVVSIDFRAFYGCSSLSSIVFGENLSYIDGSAFLDCEAISTVRFKDISTWYITLDEKDWKSQSGGVVINVVEPSINALYLKSSYNYYWYKT